MTTFWTEIHNKVTIRNFTNEVDGYDLSNNCIYMSGNLTRDRLSNIKSYALKLAQM